MRTFWGATLATLALTAAVAGPGMPAAAAAADDHRWLPDLQTIDTGLTGIVDVAASDDLVAVTTADELLILHPSGDVERRVTTSGPLAISGDQVLVGTTRYDWHRPTPVEIPFGCSPDEVDLHLGTAVARCGLTVRIVGPSTDDTIALEPLDDWEMRYEGVLVITSATRTVFRIDGVEFALPGTVPADGKPRAVPWNSGVWLRLDAGWSWYSPDAGVPEPELRWTFPGTSGASLHASSGSNEVVVERAGERRRYVPDHRTWSMIDTGTIVAVGGSLEARGGGGFFSLRRADDAIDLWHLVDLITTDCTVIGTPFSDLLFGTEGDDIICSFSGDDMVWGLDGHDVVRTSHGDDIVWAGPGNDIVWGGSTVFGGDGDDSLHVGNGFAWGQAGDDRLVGGVGAMLGGGDGNDRLRGSGLTAFGGSGDDSFSVELGVVFGGDGNDQQYDDTDGTTAYLGAGDDSWGPCTDCAAFGGPGRDTLYAVDEAHGGEGDDYIYDHDAGVTYTFLAVGGDGDDEISLVGGGKAYGGEGNDLLTTPFFGGGEYFGGPGDDTLVGGLSSDRLWGGPGLDTIDGRDGVDVCWANGGSTINCEPDSST